MRTPTSRVTSLALAYVTSLLAVAATLLVSSATPRIAAQSTTPTPGHGFVGAWRLTFATPRGDSPSLLTVMADGTVVFSGLPVKPAASGVPVTFVSAGHGAWQQLDADTASFTWIGFVTDGQGAFLALATDSAGVTLGADGDSWRGDYSAEVTDPEGNVLFVGNGAVRATRITVQPLAMPGAGTPVIDLD